MFFSDIKLLWVLVPLYILWAMAWFVTVPMGRRWRILAPSSLRFSSTHRLNLLKPSWAVRVRPFVLGLRLLAVLFLVVAMTRPQTGRKHTKVTSEGIDIMLVLDTSGSMQALDLDVDKPVGRRRNRLQVVKDVVASFVEHRENDQIGIVVFGSEAFTQCPLTLDHGIVSTFLDRVELGVAGDSTALGSALGTAVKRLKKSDAKSKVVILLTDGRNNSGVLAPRKAAEIAKTFGIKVYAIGAGTRDKAPILVDTIFGRQVQYIQADIDEPTLKEIAETTGGDYFRAEDASALEAIYKQIDKLEKTRVETRYYMEYNERFPLFVIPAVFLLILEMLLLGTRFRKIP